MKKWEKIEDKLNSKLLGKYNQLSEIITMLGEPKVKKAIEKTGDLDYASLAAFSVLKAQPKFIKFAPLLLKPFI